ncbi:MAG: L-serine ammonia-lyase, iron-sulfur-dependent, subunit alpha [Atopobiaceae bacterium]|jgi:L-serine dehydratase|nr:L-serine ammonia-lyase, iron-sulfur-dependent, subunit alpha [Atopobiaceae bacterium]
MRTSAFEILGPIMVGPSSSHTAGALRIALVARSLGPRPFAQVDFTLYNSFAQTYKGHGTDRALVAGILGLAPDDRRVRDSFTLAEQAGLAFSFSPASKEAGVGRHPNTVRVNMLGRNGQRTSVTGESLGGGRIRISSIDDANIELTGDYPTLFIVQHDRPGALASITGTLSATNTNIASIHTFRKERGGFAYTIIEVDEPISSSVLTRIQLLPQVVMASKVDIPGTVQLRPDSARKFDFNTGSELLGACKREHVSIGKLMRAREIELLGADTRSEQLATKKMTRVLDAMRAETTAALEKPKLSLGGLIGGQARSVAQAASRYSAALLGTTLSQAVTYAMATIERSASMGVIVAAPTAGSAGIVPGAVRAVAKATHATQDQMLQALWCASAIGALLARNASVAGAEGGCQAEVGSAAAMGAAALVELLGGTAQTALSAASTALANLLGLVCDPVRGLVEYPCQNRNVIGVVDAFSAAQLALSGVRDPIPFDEVVDAMQKVGQSLPATLRETALGGLAAEPSAASARSLCALCDACDS